jgi:hypothetical protein
MRRQTFKVILKVRIDTEKHSSLFAPLGKVDIYYVREKLADSLEIEHPAVDVEIVDVKELWVNLPANKKKV